MACYLEETQTVTEFTPKLAFFDLDGTLVNSSGGISSEAQLAVQQLQKMGVHTCIATGRPYFATFDIIKTLGISQPSMFFSGALIVDPCTQKPLQLKYLDKSSLSGIIALARKLNLYTEIYTTETYFVDARTEYTPIHTEYLHREPQEKNIAEVASQEDIVKIGIMVPRGSELEYDAQFRQAFPEIPNAIAYGAAHPDIAFLNFTSTEASRENAFEFFLQHYNITAQEIIAFGDGHSDIPFLKLAGCGVAMKNGDPQVHEAANFVTLSVEREGVPYALKKLVFEGNSKVSG